jgi:2-polyprenyl-3-methyl-5-hydroxy-6-metoxy-1,4-benzoquinol methylase
VTQDQSKVEKAVQHCYSTWGESYYEDYYGKKAPYPPVHVDMLRSRIRASGAKTLLDAGCGPASFLRHLTNDGLNLYGFDLTAEMVREAKRVMSSQGIPERNFWQGSVLRPSDFHRPDLPPSYDAAVCFGVLPHIPADKDEVVLRNLFQAVIPGGLVLIEARNALFSLFTQNRYTYEFICNELIRPQNLMPNRGKPDVRVLQALEKLKLHFRMDLPPVRKGKQDEPGYDEVLSRTHVPFVLENQFQKAGFRDTKIFFYHFHALPPMFAVEVGDFFKTASLRMEQPEDWRGYFMASAFVLQGTKI